MNYKESIIQKGIVRYFALKNPKLKGLLCCNLNNSKNKTIGGINNGLGVIAGRSDLVLYYHKTAYHIEVKEPKGTQSDAQIAWQKLIESHGYNYYIVHSTFEFTQVLKTLGI